MIQTTNPSTQSLRDSIQGQQQGYPGMGLQNAAIPREKGPISNAQETLGYLGELECLNADIRRKLYGAFPEDPGNPSLAQREQSLEEMLRWICQRTAMAVGDAKNLPSKLD